MPGHARALIAALKLKRHPEGGWYRETYRSRHSTAILYLLERGGRSALHRIKSDELWHFHDGGALIVAELDGGGAPRLTRLGGRNPQHVVKAGTWFGAYPAPGTAYALVGCTVAPAFRFADFELGDRETLLKRYPRAKSLIAKLT